jgi:hypothetical protein
LTTPVIPWAASYSRSKNGVALLAHGRFGLVLRSIRDPAA